MKLSTMSETGKRLYQSILNNPEDTSLRLVFADWLELEGGGGSEDGGGLMGGESDSALRAEIIRLQCRDRSVANPFCSTCQGGKRSYVKLSGPEDGGGLVGGGLMGGGGLVSCACVDCWRADVAREREILGHSSHNIHSAGIEGGGMIDPQTKMFYRCKWFEPYWRDTEWGPHIVNGWTFGRGFVEHVRYTNATWFRREIYGVVKEHPILSLEITDRTPEHCVLGTSVDPSKFGGEYRWNVGSRGGTASFLANWVPEVFQPYLLRVGTGKWYRQTHPVVDERIGRMYYRTAEEAKSALGRAYLMWAKDAVAQRQM